MHEAALDRVPGFRRRFRVTPGHNEVLAEVEDDFHCMRVTIRHSDGVAWEIEAVVERAPWNTCPGAEQRLQQTFRGVALNRFAERGEKRDNCTHLHDLATLAAAHAFDPGPRTYDVIVSDPVGGRSEAELRRDGNPVLHWVQAGGQFVEPAEIAGLTLDKLGPWIATLEPHLQETARILRWGAMIAHGRLIPIAKQSDAKLMPVGNCYTFQPEMRGRAQRIGEIRDFSRGSVQPLERQTMT